MQNIKVFQVFISIFAAVSGNSDLDSRITGGYDVKLGTIKSFVALEVEFEDMIRWCGGFLGPPGDRIYTAASCLNQ